MSNPYKEMSNPYEIAEKICKKINNVMNNVPDSVHNWSYLERLRYLMVIKTNIETWEEITKHKMRKDSNI